MVFDERSARCRNSLDFGWWKYYDRWWICKGQHLHGSSFTILLLMFVKVLMCRTDIPSLLRRWIGIVPIHRLFRLHDLLDVRSRSSLSLSLR